MTWHGQDYYRTLECRGVCQVAERADSGGKNRENGRKRVVRPGRLELPTPRLGGVKSAEITAKNRLVPSIDMPDGCGTECAGLHTA